MKKLKIGILGLGHLGKIHLKCLRNTDFEIVGFFDPDPSVQKQFSEEIESFDSPAALIQAVDAVDIVSPTPTHCDLIIRALKEQKHVFVEKPICMSLEELEKIKLYSGHSMIQVGHVERFNPAFIPLKGKDIRPLFIEGHRIAEFNPRGSDVSVVLDLMIHDLDILMALVNAEVTQVNASGVSIVSNHPDIANARIEFSNGCVANLTASRISMRQMRKFRIFSTDAYISLDFLEKKLSFVKLSEEIDGNSNDGFVIDTVKGKKKIEIVQPDMKLNNAIEDELNAFYSSISNGIPVEVGLEAAAKALDLACVISDQISEKEQKFFS